MKNINKYTSDRLNDYIIDCDVCGAPCWYSETTKLKPDTGRGGCLVCSRDKDPIDYGLVPFKIRAEKPVKETRINTFNQNSNIVSTRVFDLSTFNPLAADNPNLSTQSLNWEEIDTNWEDIDINWEDL